jgi:hypothetical protein
MEFCCVAPASTDAARISATAVPANRPHRMLNRALDMDAYSTGTGLDRGVAEVRSTAIQCGTYPAIGSRVHELSKRQLIATVNPARRGVVSG